MFAFGAKADIEIGLSPGYGILLQVDTSKMLRNKQEARIAVYLGPYSEETKGLSTNLQSIGTIALVRGHLADGPFMHICIIFTNS